MNLTLLHLFNRRYMQVPLRSTADIGAAFYKRIYCFVQQIKCHVPVVIKKNSACSDKYK